ncbi:MAG TPA: hypothetical protein ENH59_01465 [Bacteroidetes bacterium]|nr:hypothetical protein [Bacteroidota bacterium]
MDNEEYLKELLKWVSSDSLLIIDVEGLVRRIYCPFEVICLAEFNDIDIGEKVSVDAYKISLSLKEVYIIKGKAYLIYYFRIIL